jgi:hypothetical protein
MDLLIPGARCPGKDFDLFLEPLIENWLNYGKVSAPMMLLLVRNLTFMLLFCGVYMIIQH